MPRRLRSVLPNGTFHVTALGVDHAPIFGDGLDRRSFLSLLSDSVERFGWDVYAYCLMTTHYHLVIATTVEDLSRGMHRLNGTHALRFNRRHKRCGHLFGDRFWAEAVDTDEPRRRPRLRRLQPRPRRTVHPARAMAVDRLWSTLPRAEKKHLFLPSPTQTPPPR